MSPKGTLQLGISFSVDKIKKDEIDRTCSSHETIGKSSRSFCPKAMKEADSATGLGVNRGFGK
jgi:hypothetical protein